MDPDSAVSEVQRKIELQSPEDLAFLISNVRRAAASRLDEAFPPVDRPAGEEDPLRAQIETLVNEYIDRTFSLAAPNISINGLPVPASFLSDPEKGADTPSYEPFDARKRRAVADLITQEEKLLEDVAALKRSVPGKVAAARAEHVRAGMRRDEEDLKARVERAAADSSGMGMGMQVGVAGLERQEGVERGYRDAVGGLARMKREMPAVVARMERARMAGEYVAGKR